VDALKESMAETEAELSVARSAVEASRRDAEELEGELGGVKGERDALYRSLASMEERFSSAGRSEEAGRRR
jgi:chromosome segregation ATPase